MHRGRLISKDRRQGILQTFAHFPHEKKTAGSEKRNCHLFYVCTCILYLSCHGGRVSKFYRLHFSEERQGG